MTDGTLTADVRRALDSIASDTAAKADAPSLRAALFDRTTELWSYDYGDVAQQYRIGSITKTFTAVLVMRMRDDGLIDLNDAIGTHVRDAPYAGATIRDLLSHRSGMTAEPLGPWWERTPGQEWASLVAANAAGRRVFDAGVRHHYSNLGYGLLGELVSRIRGRDWYDVLRDELLHPLALHETTYHPRTDAASGTSRNPITRELQGEPAQDTRAMAAAGQLWSTTADLARWAQVLVGAVPDVVSIESVREMQTAHSADVDEQHQGAYGLGLRLRWRAAGTLVGHTGSMPGFVAGLFVEPSDGVGGVLLANCTTGIASERVIAELLTASGHVAVERRRGPSLDEGAKALVTELEGEWYWGNTAMTLTADPVGFELGSRAEGRAHFRPSGSDRFVGTDEYWNGETLSVVRSPDGGVSHLEVVTFVLTRTPYDLSAPIPGGQPLPLR